MYRLALNDVVVVGTDETVFPVRLLASVNGQIGRPFLLCLGIAEGYDCSTHESAPISKLMKSESTHARSDVRIFTPLD
jgi:hypothetical protein